MSILDTFKIGGHHEQNKLVNVTILTFNERHFVFLFKFSKQLFDSQLEIFKFNKKKEQIRTFSQGEVLF
jgi:hypothetical protein